MQRRGISQDIRQFGVRLFVAFRTSISAGRAEIFLTCVGSIMRTLLLKEPSG